MIYKNGYLVKALYKGASPVKNVFKGSNLVFGNNEPVIECDNVLSFTLYGGTSYTFTINNNVYSTDSEHITTIDEGNRIYRYTITLEELGITDFTNAVSMFSPPDVQYVYLQEVNSIPCTNNVISMAAMFRSCGHLTSINLNIDTSNVTTLSQLFDYCGALSNVDLSSFNTSNVRSLSYMFRNCYMINQLDLSSFNTSKVTTISYMFDACMSLTTLNVSGWDISNIGTYTNTFRNCSKLTSLILGDVTQEQYNFWYQRLVDAGIQNNVTITYNLI